jgi:hypothetical protein
MDPQEFAGVGVEIVSASLTAFFILPYDSSDCIKQQSDRIGTCEVMNGETKRNKASAGVFERPKESGIWWINYYVKGKQRREKAGNRSAAVDLYRARKADAWRGIKLPELRNGRVTVSALIDDALKYARIHNKSVRDYECKAGIVRKEMDARVASEIKPQEIDTWLSKFKTNATANRYKAFLSLIYREGIRNGKVQVNPARQVPQRKEGTGRLRFLSLGRSRSPIRYGVKSG